MKKKKKAGKSYTLQRGAAALGSSEAQNPRPPRSVPSRPSAAPPGSGRARTPPKGTVRKREGLEERFSAGCIRAESDLSEKRSRGFYGRVYERRALRGRGGRSPERPRAHSPPSSCWKQVFPRPPRPSDTVSVTAAAAAGRRSQARGAARGGRTPSLGPAPQPRAQSAPQPRSALPARRRCRSRRCRCAGPPACGERETRPSFRGAPRWAGKNDEQFPQRTREHTGCAARVSSCRSLGGSSQGDIRGFSSPPVGSLPLEGLAPHRVLCRTASSTSEAFSPHGSPVSR